MEKIMSRRTLLFQARPSCSREIDLAHSLQETTRPGGGIVMKRKRGSCVYSFSTVGFPGFRNTVDQTDNPVSGPSGDCDYQNNYIYVDASGERHDLGLLWVSTLNSAINACSAIGQVANLVGGDAKYRAQITD